MESCVPNLDVLTNLIFKEARRSRYSIISISKKMYHELREVERFEKGHSGICC